MSEDEGETRGSASNQYQKLSQLEHVLKRPDTYIGSVEFHDMTMWVCKPDGALEYRNVSIVPGLYKIFDEILVNAADNKVRDPKMKNIKVTINTENNEISVLNDGQGIPIEIHDKEKIYIPELIFGHLLTSSNYNDEEQKVTGGRNGYGAKLCNIFSQKFVLETSDKKNVYRQVWENNMSVCHKPTITRNPKKTSYTSITFYPDLEKFGMDRIDEDLTAVLRRRVHDIAGTTRDICVTLNGEVVAISDFKAYVNMFVKGLDDDEETKVLYCKPNDRWEIAFALSNGTFNQMSFVNSIATTSGGSHVNYIADQLVSHVLETMTKKNKSAGGRGGKLQRPQVKCNMFVFINSKITNPSFTSQTKEQLTTKASAFGSKCEIPDKFLRDVVNSTGLVDRLLAISEQNAHNALKRTDGGKKRRLTKFVKLDDANKAGTRESHKCTLILTEGDSAKASAVEGLSVIGRDYFGCFPLRGKLLNVREASSEQVLKNEEIQALKQIIGLQHKKTYTSVEGLRYGHVMIMTDQDYDGSHIKGLLINFFESSFPGLLQIPGFLVEFITPIVKVTVMRGRREAEVIPFYTMPQYELWRDTVGQTCKWKQMYYKGLGSSSPEEHRGYFLEIDTHKKTFKEVDDNDRERIELAFAKARADDRKTWLHQFQQGTYLDPELDNIPVSEFIDKELILFSMADNVRSIPSVMDGLKPVQRKVLWASFTQKVYNKLKVPELAALVSKQAAYHHGEAAMLQTIIALAQNFIGTNNVYYLLPKGTFGSRAMGGKDASAARYIHTCLNPMSRLLFHEQDGPLLRYLSEDDASVEPEYFVPILPTLLVNGSEGIGTGWSTNIPMFNPMDILSNLRKMMDDEAPTPMLPWYRGWTGIIEPVPGSNNSFRVCGRIEEIDNNTLAITELPVRMWTQTMKEYLLKSIIGSSLKADEKKSASGQFIEDFTEEHTSGIRFIVKLSDKEMEKAKQVGLYTKFKLIVPMSTSNMVAFDSQGRLKRYETPIEILKEFYHVRLDYYQRRKDNRVQQLRNELEKLASQARFIKLIIEKKLSVSNRKRADVTRNLRELRFPVFSSDGVPIFDFPEEDEDDEEEEEEGDTAKESFEEEMKRALDPSGAVAVVKPKVATYDYLLSMAIMSLTKERYERLLRMRDLREQELTELLAKDIKVLWRADLDTFESAWKAFLIKDEEQRDYTKNKPKKTKAKRKADDDDEFNPAAKRKRTTKKAVKEELPPSVVIPVPSFEEAKAKVKREPKVKSETPEEPKEKPKPKPKEKAAKEPKEPKAKAAPRRKVKAALSDSDSEPVPSRSVTPRARSVRERTPLPKPMEIDPDDSLAGDSFVVDSAEDDSDFNVTDDD